MCTRILIQNIGSNQSTRDVSIAIAMRQKTESKKFFFETNNIIYMRSVSIYTRIYIYMYIIEKKTWRACSMHKPFLFLFFFFLVSFITPLLCYPFANVFSASIFFLFSANCRNCEMKIPATRILEGIHSSSSNGTQALICYTLSEDAYTHLAKMAKRMLHKGASIYLWHNGQRTNAFIRLPFVWHAFVYNKNEWKHHQRLTIIPCCEHSMGAAI